MFLYRLKNYSKIVCTVNYFAAISTLSLIFTLASAAVAQTEDADEASEAARTQAVAKFNEGQDAHEKGDFRTALKFYDEAVKIAPEFPEVEFQRGNALLSLNRLSDAEKAYRRAVELREDWSLPMANLGAVLIAENKFPEAETVLNRAVALDADNFPAYASLAELRLKTKAAPDTLRELLLKIKSLTGKANPTAALWSARGALEAALGDNLSAKTSLNNALALDPKNIFALQSRVEIAIAENDFTKALNDARQLVQFSPNSTNAQVTLARVYAENGEQSQADKILNTLDPKDSSVIALRKALAESNSTDTKTLEAALEKDANNAALLGRLCILLRVENPSKALDYCRRAAAVEPNNLNHAVGYGAALVQAKEYAAAVSILQKIKQIAPDNYTARANLATALFQLKRYAEAVGEYQWLTEKQSKLAIGYYFLAISFDNLEQYKDAMANYQLFLKIADPTANQLEIDKVKLRLPTLEILLKKANKK